MTRFGADDVSAVAAQPLVSELVSMIWWQALEDMTTRVQRCEADLEHIGKRGSCHVHIV